MGNLGVHLITGDTSVCRCWKVTRKDGQVFGFTDHDGDLVFDGVTYSAQTGLTARALEQTTGLSVDNSEAYGALSDAALREEDIVAGRFDGAEVVVTLVNWADVAVREVIFRGAFGDVAREGGAFRAELRGLTEGLNQLTGAVYHAACGAALGDARCGVDLDAPGMTAVTTVAAIGGALAVDFEPVAGMDAAVFDRGRVVVLDGGAEGLAGVLRKVRADGAVWRAEFWQGIWPLPAVDDTVRLVAGCDKRAETCRDKFNNFSNFRGFPHIPGEDWLRAYPTASGA